MPYCIRSACPFLIFQSGFLAVPLERYLERGTLFYAAETASPRNNRAVKKKMTQAAKKFIEFWNFQRGSEKGEDQKFWNSLLADVLGVDDITTFIQYQVPVHYKGTTKFLDAWIPSTRVLIEHKTRGVDLDAPQAGHDGQTPFQQAWDYDNNRPMREKARWIVVCNFDEIRIHDMDADVPETTFERITLGHLAKEIHRLKFLVHAENSIRARELEVSVKAGRVVGKLYNSFLESYGEMAKDPEVLKTLNKLCVRLVFCVYAEDSGVFAKDQFLEFMRKFHYSSFHLQLAELFKVLRLRPEERGPFFSDELKAFPFVGGGLFKEDIPIAPFSEKTAKILLDDASEAFDWNEISPTIFGAVFESTLNPETRRKDGMHYTSEENIHKVIDPLFLDDLRGEFAAIKSEPNLKKRTSSLVAYQEKLGSLRFLDPACGSGNFLTETYISLRKLENEALSLRFNGQGQFDLEDTKLINVSINQFYGIEINDFAVTVAQTAMWIAECKMMQETNAILSKNFTPLPLTDSAKIIEANALHVDWEENLRINERLPSAHFDYIMGNPPFVGASMMTDKQKREAVEIFGNGKLSSSIDYVGAWYYKACAMMVNAKTRAAFVSTNSITQGEQVAPLWAKLISEYALSIDFAWRTFVWDSEATDKAHVHVVIIGFSTGADPGARHQKCIFKEDGQVVVAERINPYLIDATTAFISNRSTPICDVPLLTKGNQPTDDGNFIFSEEEARRLLDRDPKIATLIHRYVGAKDYLNGGEVRYCMWLKDVSPSFYVHNAEIHRRLANIQTFRSKSTAAPTRAFAERPYQFFSSPQDITKPILVIPRVSSQRRKYIPIGYLGAGIVAADSLSIVADVTLCHFAVLTSSVHMAWMRTVAGRLKSDYRYSAAVVYNNFPWPNTMRLNSSKDSISTSSPLHDEMEKTARAILDAREHHPDSSLADLYDPLSMPQELRKAHAANDAAVMKAYGFPPDLDESCIVSRLFEMYAELTNN